MARPIQVEVRGDVDNYVRNLGRAEVATGRFASEADRGHSRLATFGRAAAIAGAGLAVGLGVAVVAATRDVADHQQALAQTQAALTSTGGVANVTADHIVALADSIEKLSGQDDVATQKGENLLLTFTNVRNETGKGLDIFDQATMALADMAAAMGGDASSQAIRLGKALNDPIKGVSALTKVGVTFDAQQKALIKRYVEHGHMAQAQAIILKELQKEFGGSAAAAGQTLAGQLNILKARFFDVADAVVADVVPALTNLTAWVDTEWQRFGPQITKTADDINVQFHAVWPSIQSVVTTALGDMVTAGTTAFEAFQEVIGFLGDHQDEVVAFAGAVGTLAAAWLVYQGYLVTVAVATRVMTVAQLALNLVMEANPIGIVVVALAALVGGLILAYEKSDTARNIINAAWNDIKAVSDVVWGGLQAVLENVVIPAIDAVQAHGDQIKAALVAAWNVIRDATENVFNAVAQIVRGVMTVIQGVVNVAMGLITGDWSRAWDGVKQIVSGALDAVRGVINLAIAPIRAVASNFGDAITNAIRDAVVGIGNKVGDLINDIPGVIRGLIGSVGSAAEALGSRIWTDIRSGVGALSSKLTGLLGDLRDALTSFDIGAAAAGLGHRIWSGILSGLGNIASYVTTAIRNAVNGIIDRFNSAVSLHFSIDTHIPGVGTQSISIDPPDVPHLARGGIVRARPGGTPVLAAEAGVDEAFIPLTPGILDKLGGLGGVNVTQNFYSQGTPDPRLLEAEATWALRRLAVVGV